jgi:hypothetical protein
MGQVLQGDGLHGGQALCGSLAKPAAARPEERFLIHGLIRAATLQPGWPITC